jgi:integrase
VANGLQAKILSEAQELAALVTIAGHRYPKRDKVIFMLSFRAGLRAKEIACLTCAMVTDVEGELATAIDLTNDASKGASGRRIALNAQLRQALLDLFATYDGRQEPDAPVVRSERGGAMTPHSIVEWFGDLYRGLGFDGCSSHSGRRTFITRAAKKIHAAGGSLRDVQSLAGHKYLNTTQKYIEGDSEAQRRVVDLI